MPEPSSVVTKSAATTRQPSAPGGGARKVEGPLVAPADEVGAGEALDDLGVLGARGAAAMTRSRPPSVAGDPHVVDVGADRGGDVGDERPRRGGPHQEVDVAVASTGKRT